MKRLWTTFRYTFRGLRGQILGWGLGLAIHGFVALGPVDRLHRALVDREIARLDGDR